MVGLTVQQAFRIHITRIDELFGGQQINDRELILDFRGSLTP